jgi:hypothetical protein
VDAGFDSGFSLFYSSSADAIIKIYDGLDGTGNLLATLNLVTNFKNNNCSATASEFDEYCHWDLIGVNFKGKAKSVVFDGDREFTLYDNITLGSDIPNKCKKPKKRKSNSHFKNDDDARDENALRECKDSRLKRKYQHSNEYGDKFSD